MEETSQLEGRSGRSRLAAREDGGTRPGAARLSLLGAAMFLVLLAILHVFKPELDPSWRVISEYAIGDFGWVMAVAFLSLAIGCVALFFAIRSQAGGVAGRIGLAFLLLAAAGLTLAAVFTTDPTTAGPDEATTTGSLHTVGATLGTGIPIAAVFIGWSLRRNRAWSSARRSLFWAAVLAWAGFLAFSVSMAVMLPENDGRLGPDVLIGWPNRFMIAAYSVWVMMVAWQATKRPSWNPFRELER